MAHYVSWYTVVCCWRVFGRDPALASMHRGVPGDEGRGQGRRPTLIRSLRQRATRRSHLLALIGGPWGQGVGLVYRPVFRAVFLQSIMKVDGYTPNLLIRMVAVVRTASSSCRFALSDQDRPASRSILAGCLSGGGQTFSRSSRLITTMPTPGWRRRIENREGRGCRRSRSGLRRSVSTR